MKKIWKALLSMLLAGAILFSQLTLFASAAENDYLAIQANKYDLGRTVNVNGYTIKGDLEDYSRAIYYLLSGEEAVADEIETGKDYTAEEPVYCSSKVELKVDSFVNNTIFASEKTIRIEGDSLSSEETAVIYSNSGDIVIDCDEIAFSGVICAPKGKVTITSKNVNIKGCIIADKVTIHAKNAEISPDESSENLAAFIKGYRNEGYMCFHAYMEDGDLGVYCDSNLNMSRGIVYVRYDDAYVFNNVGEFETNQGWIADFEFDRKIDVIVEGRTVFGEVILSDVVSMEKDDTGQINYIHQDSDQDGIEDGIEIYYLKSDPYNADTDGDGIGDGIEAFHLYTDPTEANDEESDYDEDGVANAEVEEIPVMPKGTFDRIITYFDADGNCKQYVYDWACGRKVGLNSI